MFPNSPMFPEASSAIARSVDELFFFALAGSVFFSALIFILVITFAVKFRRPSKAFEDGIQKFDLKYLMTLDDVIASRGGIPLVVDGKLVGAIGCSGGTGSQDEAICTVGAATVK